MVEEDRSKLMRSHPNRFKRTGCHRTQPIKPVGSKPEGRHSQHCYLRGIIPCDLRPFLHFSPNGGRSLTGGCSSPVCNTACCIWNGQVENGALSRFNHTAVLTHDPLKIRFGPSSSTTRPKWLVFDFDHIALRPQKRGCLLRIGGEDERVKARPRIPLEKDRRDRGPPTEQWNC